jgi:hypothetical protein
MKLQTLLAPVMRQASIASVCLTAAACFIIKSNSVDVEAIPVHPASGFVLVQSPVKAHLKDGSTLLFRGGVTVFHDSVVANGAPGQRFDIGLRPASTVRVVPLDSVAGMENYVTRTNAGTSVALTVVASTAATALTALSLVALFGSCPTIYADSAGTAVLQAEVFANRISPLFEARDIDLLSVTPDRANMVRLEVRNEALETHYINQFELLEVPHARDETIVPDEHGRPLALAGFRAAGQITDRAGTDLRRTLARTDGIVFATAKQTMLAATDDDPNDYIDLVVPTPPGAKEVAVVMHLRNSLLNTVLLYDLMLAGPGARSLDWLAHDMTRIGPVLQLGRWYRGHFGLRVLQRIGDSWQEVERHPTYGPIAWRDVATVVPTHGKDSVRLRLSFVADEWRIDRVSVAASVRRPESRVIALTAVDAGDSSISRDALRSMRGADERYLQTTPGQHFSMRFDVGPAPATGTRTFLLASQGYYTEWVRGGWIKSATDSVAFKPTAGTLVKTIRRWDASRDSIESRFYSSRVPVR